MFLVSAQIRSNRLEICKNCDHYLTSTRSCGTLGFGSEVESPSGEKIKLCGCIMPVKTRLKTSSCPLNKWGMEIGEDDIEHIKNLLQDIEGKSSVTAQQNQMITDFWNKAAGGNANYSNCNSCVRKMIKELKQFVEYDT